MKASEAKTDSRNGRRGPFFSRVRDFPTPLSVVGGPPEGDKRGHRGGLKQHSKPTNPTDADAALY